MATQWLNSNSALSARATAVGQHLWQRLQQPRQARLFRHLGLLLAAAWLLFALGQLFWALWPQPPVEVPATPINPAVGAVQTQPGGVSVDLEALRSAALFGVRDGDAAQPEPALATGPEDLREGIEEGARETRLDLVLRGVAASPMEGLGSAVIEVRGQQAVFAVDDPLPLPGRVVLAKVLPDRVVLDNAGTYELLRLYDESDLDRQLHRQPRVPNAAAPPRQIDHRGDPEVASLAGDYRRQLYRNPQSLSELVRITPVRENGQLQGYRIAPGRDRDQFERLGFQAGDLVVAVNGLPLSDPANTMRLYQAMRSASEATFELQRDGQSLAVSVSLGDAAPDA